METKNCHYCQHWPVYFKNGLFTDLFQTEEMMAVGFLDTLHEVWIYEQWEFVTSKLFLMAFVRMIGLSFLRSMSPYFFLPWHMYRDQEFGKFGLFTCHTCSWSSLDFIILLNISFLLPNFPTSILCRACYLRTDYRGFRSVSWDKTHHRGLIWLIRIGANPLSLDPLFWKDLEAT